MLRSDPALRRGPTFAQIYRRSGHVHHPGRGRDDRGRFCEMAFAGCGFICVSTGGRILGLGGHGCQRSGHSRSGSLQLYTPAPRCRPTELHANHADIATTNARMREIRFIPRDAALKPTTRRRHALTDEFVSAVARGFPGAGDPLRGLEGLLMPQECSTVWATGSLLQRLISRENASVRARGLTTHCRS